MPQYLYTPYRVKFDSTMTVYQQQIRCHIQENEFNYTLNPTAMRDSSGSLADNVTGSAFMPYVTTIGLYNEANELLIVAKLARPFPVPQNTDVTFIVKYDF